MMSQQQENKFIVSIKIWLVFYLFETSTFLADCMQLYHW